MARWWTGLALGFSLLGTLVLGASCYATPQEPQASVGADKRTDESESSNRKASKPDAPVERTSRWEDRENRVGLHLLKNIAEDQKALWIGPKNLRLVDADWLVPLGGAAAAMFATDSTYSRHLSNSPNRIKYSKDLSNYGLASMVGIGGGLYLWGHLTHDDHKIETGILAGEAAIDTLAPVYAMKYAFGRERPLQDNYRGRFGQGGVSFPSEHAAAAWSIASVIAHEYPGPLTSLFVYGLASAVSASRISGKQHFPSDVLVGSAIGWLEGMYVYRKHHDPKVGGGDWETYAEAHDSAERNTGNLGSPYVPLDSWIYPAMERLAGLGMLNDEFMGMRPWTRSECARLVGAAADHPSDGSNDNTEASRMIEALQREFRSETEETDSNGQGAFRLESLYSRTEHISGTPLTDGYTFAQTQINDFGRPYGEGWGTINGFSAYASRGRWVAYVRGEAQTAPSTPAPSLSTRETIQQVDLYPQLPPDTGRPSVGQFKLLDAYVGIMLSNWQVSFGKQSLWWGPGDGGPMMFSDNAAPINMFRVNRITPLKLPSILGWLGPMRTEFFLGQLAGSEFVFTPSGFAGQFGQSLSPQPFINGQKISFKPTRNFELGVFRTTVYGGPGYPLTWHTFFRSLFSTANRGTFGTPEKPGDRRSGVDFSYRLPGLRKWLTFYGDGFTDDQFSPIGYFDRSAWHAGLYLCQFPRLPKLDLRVEGVYTDNPIGGNVGHGFYYFNFTWRSGYTNDGNLIGSWIGREGQGAQAWTNYWFTARNRLQFNFRHQKVSQEFIPGGGSLTDAGVRADYWVRPNVSLSTSVQYERWLFPVIQPNAQRNVAASVEILFQPQKLFRRSVSNADTTTSENGGRL
ncbi:MAG TPA: capsule assembly Wzi family protein [Candidatus Dormibacteraeota bacterium]|nr:capsule assembly Wzi family protein [Candidatus Dormibacteraeota bacterium]